MSLHRRADPGAPHLSDPVDVRTSGEPESAPGSGHAFDAWLDARITEEGRARIEAFFADCPEPDPAWGTYADRPGECPNGPHRGPQGPCEDLGQCGLCLMPSFRMRPPGECFGEHAPDCSLPERHESFCIGGGQGHPKAEVLRG